MIYFQSYDDHVRWCEEKAKRLQDAPTKDYQKIAKLNLRVSYRPRTPKLQRTPVTRTYSEQPAGRQQQQHTQKQLTRTYSLRKPSNERAARSLQPQPQHQGLRRTKSFGKSGISYLMSTDHTKETQETQFIRNATGRGSIKKGPAPTKSFLLRMQVSLWILIICMVIRFISGMIT